MECVEGYKKVRRANKGLHTSFIPIIVQTGYYNGMRCADYANAKNIPRSNAYSKLSLAVNNGWLVKRGVLYYLTDSGAKVRQDALNAMSELAAVMRKDFIEAAKRAIKR